MLALSVHPKRVEKIVDGWAAFGDGWAVHAPTKESVLKEYEQRVKFYKELSKRPENLSSQEIAQSREKET